MNLHLARSTSSGTASPRRSPSSTSISGCSRARPTRTRLRLDLLAKLGRKAEGLPWLEQASQADPLNVNLKMLLASQYAAAGSSGKAADVYQALVAETPTEEAYRAYFKLLIDTDRVGSRKMLDQFDAAVHLGTPKRRSTDRGIGAGRQPGAGDALGPP